MRSVTRRVLRHLLFPRGYLCLAIPAAAAQDAPPASGVLWEATSQMTREGMPFGPPATTRKVCTPGVWTEPPGTGEQDLGGRAAGPCDKPR